ncbi:hypothetical protein BIV23_24860 [Streptomyces monashensis]|uniref:Uncharacterized protein n=1 Tax=Streptomyces monashensis TaxID=1678012 RepID=A0A1S2QA30_9ACTN|nr:hypothetical protein BIV23_24860 [Streptomyces monashensis]
MAAAMASAGRFLRRSPFATAQFARGHAHGRRTGECGAGAVGDEEAAVRHVTPGPRVHAVGAVHVRPTGSACGA